MLIPFSTRPAQPICCRLTPAVAAPFFCCPVSSSAPITSFPRRRPALRAASSSPDTANRRISAIASASSHTARFSSRCVRSGVRSPTCSAMVQPFRFGNSLVTARTHLRACTNGSTLRKHERSRSVNSPSFRPANPAPILAAAAACDPVVLTNT